MFYPKPALSSNHEIVERVAKLIPRLGSNHDGEVVATAAAIRRTLEAGGFDFNDLASALASIRPEGPPLVPVARPFVQSTNSYWINWPDVIRRCAQKRYSLSDKERAFLESMLDWDGDPTEKQQKWLLDIVYRLRIEV